MKVTRWTLIKVLLSRDPSAKLDRLWSNGLVEGAMRQMATQRTLEAGTLPKAQSFNIVHTLDVGGKVEDIATRVTFDLFGQVVDVVPDQPKARDDDDTSDAA